MQEVEVSSPELELTLRVLKYLRRMCCLCRDSWKWLDIPVFSVKDVVVLCFGPVIVYTFKLFHIRIFYIERGGAIREEEEVDREL